MRGTVICTGAEPASASLDSHALVKMMQNSSVTGAFFPPTMLGLLVVTPGFDGLTCLRNCVIGAERLHISLAKRATAALPSCTFANYYGPTEATISITACRLDPKQLAAGKVPIGRPITGAALYLRQNSGTMLPIAEGVSGELCVAGPMVACGYLGDTAKTKEVSHWRCRT